MKNLKYRNECITELLRTHFAHTYVIANRLRMRGVRVETKCVLENMKRLEKDGYAKSTKEGLGYRWSLTDDGIATFKSSLTPSTSASKVNRDIERAVKAKINDELDKVKSKKEEQIIDGNKYHREIIGLDGTKTTVDVYRVLDAFKTDCAATDHAIKKMLCAGLRGHKDKVTDYDNAIESLQAARLLIMQKGKS